MTAFIGTPGAGGAVERVYGMLYACVRTWYAFVRMVNGRVWTVRRCVSKYTMDARVGVASFASGPFICSAL